ncbi:helix-turn-helix domain-containing protein [Mesorhizobium sp.]|uniref:helix-turn-helix domain-containing protein n=1 Tax=Mesorhizobium sp. TaxID=1871066 RepID=UPI000FE8D5CF|nr:helix-turn-helix domain-containing protein [Mesorhizobium sp.]RWI92869.1 MAG: DNA-binding protein [Mesorhizobium sp.]
MNEVEVKPRPIWGAKAIAAEIGVSVRSVYWMLENGTLPARKVGDRWVSDARQLHQLIRGNGEAA